MAVTTSLGETPRTAPEWVFPQRWRRAGVAYVALSLPVVALIGLWVHGRTAYLVAFALAAGFAYTVPATVVTWLAGRRAGAAARFHWPLWLGALVVVMATGLSILAGQWTGSRALDRTGVVAVAAIGVLLTAAVVASARSRSGMRALSVDLLEWAMSVLIVVAPATILWGDAVWGARESWFTVPAALATVGMVSGTYWAATLFVRLGAERCQLELGGIALALFGVLDGALQTVQGVSGFTLPSSPLLVAQAASMSMLVLIPLYIPRNEAPGLNRLPPEAQVRGGALTAVLVLAGLPVLAVVAWVERNEVGWAVPFSAAVMAALLLLAALRQLAVAGETRALYALVEEESTARQAVLARLVRSSDDERHRVASQLHEQAAATYATFVSFVHATGDGTSGSTEGWTPVRRELAQQVEALRQLALATRPLGADGPPPPTLAAPIQAYIDNVYADAAPPRHVVTVDPDLDLDWVTETVAYRVIQEALSNVRRHSEARLVEVHLRVAGTAVEVQVRDDGVGFDPDALLFESGIATMRTFAELSGGELTIDSAPGEGTAVRALLRTVPDAPAPESDAARSRGHLRVVPDVGDRPGTG
jgi:signal transduction histidine kinase